MLSSVLRRHPRTVCLQAEWIRSEEAGRDIGFETALVDWMINHRSGWKKEFAKRSRN